MNAKAEKIAFKDVHRFPSWPPCIRPFLKGLSWKIKSVIFFLFSEWTHKAGTDVTQVTSTLCIPQRKTTRTRAGDLAPGQRKGQLEFRPLMAGLTSAHSFVLVQGVQVGKRGCVYALQAQMKDFQKAAMFLSSLSSLFPTSEYPHYFS